MLDPLSGLLVFQEHVDNGINITQFDGWKPSGYFFSEGKVQVMNILCPLFVGLDDVQKNGVYFFFGDVFHFLSFLDKDITNGDKSSFHGIGCVVGMAEHSAMGLPDGFWKRFVDEVSFTFGIYDVGHFLCISIF